LNTWRQFAVPAVTPVLLNLSCIAAAIVGAPWLRRHGMEPVLSMAAGVMLGGILQAGVQIPALRRLGLMPSIGFTRARLRAAWTHPGVKLILGRMAPALLGVSVSQVSMLINTQIASHISVGAVSWLTYADRLMEFPTGLLGVAMGVVLLPRLSAAQGSGDTAGYSDMLDWGLRMVLLLALPCAIALVVFAQPLVAVLFHYGAFGARDVVMSARAVMGWGVGLMGLIGVKVLAPGFFAREDTRTPVRIAVGVLIATQLMNAAFVPLIGHAALALSIGLGATLNAALLFVGLRRRGAYTPRPGWGAYALRVGFACLGLAAVLWWTGGAIDWIGLRAHPLQRAGWMALVLGAVAAGYFALLALVGLNLRQFARRT
jgi:putative peptidoglycan lipid II flippase